MRISDWSSDVCSSDLRQRDRYLANRIPRALDSGRLRRIETGSVEGNREISRVPRETPMVAGRESVFLPTALVVLLASGLEKARITGDAVIVNVLPVRHVRHLRVAADTEGPVRALIDELHFDFVILQLRLTEAGAEQLCGNVDVRLAKLHCHAVVVAVNHARFGHHVSSDEQAAQGCQQERQPHDFTDRKSTRLNTS